MFPGGPIQGLGSICFFFVLFCFFFVRENCNFWIPDMFSGEPIQGLGPIWFFCFDFDFFCFFCKGKLQFLDSGHVLRRGPSRDWVPFVFFVFFIFGFVFFDFPIWAYFGFVFLICLICFFLTEGYMGEFPLTTLVSSRGRLQNSVGDFPTKAFTIFMPNSFRFLKIASTSVKGLLGAKLM